MAKKITKTEVQKQVEQGFPEVGQFTEKKELQSYYKHLTDEQLASWVELEGLEYNAVESAPINRMRMAMAVLYLHFPKPESTKKKSKYADFSLEDLMTLAVNNDVVFEMTDDERILRMRAIMALRAAGKIE